MVKNIKKKVIVIIGPTAIGKSDIAVTLAKNINGEIVSADSRQVYKGMNIGTGKIPHKEMRGVRHYMLDVASPKNRINVADYTKQASQTISEITRQGKTPIICGGTGFYIEELLFPSSLPPVKPDKKFRTKLGKKSANQLFAILKKKDPKRAKTIDSKNKVRLIRALEIINTLGKVPSKTSRENPYNVLIIELDAPIDFIQKRVHKRLIKRLKTGMLGEISKLNKKGLSWKALEAFGLEYKLGAKFLQNKIDKETFIRILEQDIVSYAKRQKTWFTKMRRDYKNTVVISANKKNTRKLVLNSANKFLKQN